MIRFSVPDETSQLQLWQENLPARCPLAADVNLVALIRQYPLSPASIINVIFRVSVICLQKNLKSIPNSELERCIKDEEFKYRGRQPMLA